MSLVPLPGGKLLGGTTTSPGTGGEQKASQAEMYLMDMASKKLEWLAVVFPGIQEYTDMCLGPCGLVYGLADGRLFFVFEPASRNVIHQHNLDRTLGGPRYQQGPRFLIPGKDRVVYLRVKRGIAFIRPDDFQVTLLAESPVPVGPGGDLLDGRIYFASGSHLYSFDIGHAWG